MKVDIQLLNGDIKNDSAIRNSALLITSVARTLLTVVYVHGCGSIISVLPTQSAHVLLDAMNRKLGELEASRCDHASSHAAAHAAAHSAIHAAMHAASNLEALERLRASAFNNLHNYVSLPNSLTPGILFRKLKQGEVIRETDIFTRYDGAVVSAKNMAGRKVVGGCYRRMYPDEH